MVQPLQKAVSKFLEKLKTELSNDLAIPLLSIYPEKTVMQKDACIMQKDIFRATLLTIARTWKER